MNKVILSGNICRDIELKETASGKEVVSNSVAVQREYKNEQGGYDSDFFNFVAWGTNATYLSKYAKKGDRVEIVGRLQNRSYEDRNGNKQTVTECIVENIKAFSKQKQDDKKEEKPKLTDITDNEEYNDLPF